MARSAKDPTEGIGDQSSSQERPTDRFAAVRDRRRGERAEAKRHTRQALIEAGLEEIIENGLEASLDAISARAGYTRGAFYVHFKSREDLLVAITEWMLDAIIESMLGGEHAREGIPNTVMRFLDALNAGTWPLVPRIRIAVIRLMDAVERYPALRKRVDRLIVALVERIATSVRDAQQRGLVRRDLDAAKLGSILTVTALGTIMLHDLGISIDLDPDRSALRQMISEASVAAPAPPAPRRGARRGAGATPRRAKPTTRKR